MCLWNITKHVQTSLKIILYNTDLAKLRRNILVVEKKIIIIIFRFEIV